MKVVEIKKKALEVDKEDWHMMGELAMRFKEVCEQVYSCKDCPLEKFCEDRDEHPADYLFNLMEFLDN